MLSVQNIGTFYLPTSVKGRRIKTEFQSSTKIIHKYRFADPRSRSVSGVGLRPLDCGIAGSSPAGSIDVCLLCLLCVGRGLCTGQSSRPGQCCRVCVCVSLCVSVQQ